MFLSILSEKEKIVFSQLLEVVAKSDGKYGENEENQINAYLVEMGLTKKDIPREDISVTDCINQFTKSNDNVKKSIFIELVALVFADGEYSNSEKDVIEKIQSVFSFSNEYRENVISWVNSITPLYKQGFVLAGIL